MRPPSRSMPYRLALLVALMIMALDIHVPALSAMVKEFHSNETTLQLTVSLTSFGFFVSGLLIGPLSDAWGRRRMLILCLGGFFLSTLGSFFAPNLEILLAMRFFQGLMAAGAPIVSMAILFDWYSHEQFAKMGSLMGMVITFSLACAPVIGGHLATFFGWRSVFLFLAGMTVVLSLSTLPFLPETLKEKRPFSLKQSFQDYKAMVSSWVVVGHGLLIGLLISVLISHISVASYYFVDHLKVSPSHYGYFQAMGTLGNVLFCLFTSQWVVRFGPAKVLKAGVFLSSFGSLFFLMVSLLASENPYWLTAPIFFFSAGLAMIFSPAMAQAMQAFGKQAGTMSSLLSAIRMLVIAGSAYGAGLLYQGTTHSLAIVFGVGTILILVVFASLQNTKPQEHALKNVGGQTQKAVGPD